MPSAVCRKITMHQRGKLLTFLGDQALNKIGDDFVVKSLRKSRDSMFIMGSSVLPEWQKYVAVQRLVVPDNKRNDENISMDLSLGSES